MDHLVWFISDTVDELDLDAFVERYRVCGKGEQAYPPRTMLKILLFAYSTGVFSSGKLGTMRGRATYKNRKHLAEAPFGWIKAVHGFRQFSLRGIDKVSAEWNLICLATNLRRMARRLHWV